MGGDTAPYRVRKSTRLLHIAMREVLILLITILFVEQADLPWGLIFRYFECVDRRRWFSLLIIKLFMGKTVIDPAMT